MTSASDASPLYQQDVRIAARPDVVFDLLVDAAAMQRWMGIDNQLEPRPGGALRVAINGRDVAAGEFVVVDRPRRVVFTWGWEASDALPPGSSTVEITLVPDGSGTLLTLVHRNCPPELLEEHATGWQHYLDRLSTAAVGEAGPDPWAG